MFNLLITGGGTGGHLSIAKALALECKNRGFGVFYIGSTSGQDRLWFEGSEIFRQCYFLETTGVVNKKGLGIFKALYLQFKAILQSYRILKSHQIQCVISVGGFSAGGASMASLIGRIPLFIHEQNSTLGTLNKILSPFAKAIFGSFGLRCKRFVATSYPICDEFFRTARIRSELKNILFLGGSQGAMAINSFALQVCRDLIQRNINIIHQCGKLDFKRMCDGYKELGFVPQYNNQTGNNQSDETSDKCVVFVDSSGRKRIELFAFSSNLVRKISEADFCISRAGASSLWETCANNLPCLFVPYPFAAKNHQYFNALFLKESNLCGLILQHNLNSDEFLAYIETLSLSQISSGLRKAISPNGAKEIIDEVLLRLNAL